MVATSSFPKNFPFSPSPNIDQTMKQTSNNSFSFIRFLKERQILKDNNFYEIVLGIWTWNFQSSVLHFPRTFFDVFGKLNFCICELLYSFSSHNWAWLLDKNPSKNAPKIPKADRSILPDGTSCSCICKSDKQYYEKNKKFCAFLYRTSLNMHSDSVRALNCLIWAPINWQSFRVRRFSVHSVWSIWTWATIVCNGLTTTHSHHFFRWFFNCLWPKVAKFGNKFHRVVRIFYS